MTKEVQLMVVADRFDQLTRYSLGPNRKSPREAIEQIEKENIISMELLKELKKLFVAPQDAA